ncbi:MAG: DUF2213 domain-containing protein [Desulfovibrio sp.]|jgi:hypothetical protein|nr:DUF2213 domain-containing protein [Desulfovibrio sp.]
MNPLLKLFSALLEKVAFDADDPEGWITVNGAHIPLGKGGEPKGKAGEAIGEGASSRPGKSFDYYRKEAGGDHYKAAQEFYKKELMGKPAKATMGELGEQEIKFIGKDKAKFRQDMDKDPVKAEAIQHVRDVIENGKYLGEASPKVPGGKYVSYHYFQKEIPMKDENGKPRKLIVDVGKRTDGEFEYNAHSFIHNHAAQYKDKVSHLRRAGLEAEDRAIKKAECQSSNGVLIPIPKNPPGDIIRTSGHRLPAFDTAIPHSRPRVNTDRLTFDTASRRHFDANGFLHVSLCHISKETVNEYYGSEIPGWRDLGLEANRIYRCWRSGAELAKGAETFNGLPLLKEHHKDSAADPQRDLRVGSLGTDAAFVSPYLNNSLIIQDLEAIEDLNPRDGSPAKRELSASYSYDPVFEPGSFNGEPYDFIMTNIRGNHVALVEEGRAGPDVVVADENTINPTARGSNMDFKAFLEQLLSLLSGGGSAPAAPPAADADKENAAPPAGDAESGADFEAQITAYIDSLEDKDLAAKLAEAVQAAKAAGQPAADEDPDAAGKDKPVGDEDAPDKDKEAAMDGKRKGAAPKVRAAAGVQPVTINLAADEKAVAARIRADFQAQIEAARDVRPLIGEVDPLAFDSAAGIYGKALELVGKPTKLTDPRALKELCLLACDTRRTRSTYPVIAALANDGKGDEDPAFAHLGKIRKA